jgi:hypothetical protein
MKGTNLLAIVFALLTGCAVTSPPQTIETDVSHWNPYVFSEGTATVTLKMPPGQRTLNSSPPELTYKRAQRLLLDAQYDFGAGKASYISQFEIKVELVKLKAPLNDASSTTPELDAALTAALGHSISGDQSPHPIDESFRGRIWVHYDNTADVTYTQTRESYATKVDATTVLLITGWYGPNIRKNAQWFDSRKRVLKEARDNTSVTQQ